MLILVTYDVSTENDAGKKRLRKVANICEKYGQRVQNSVFECILDAAQYIMVKADLINAINQQEDSLRFYQLGNNYQNRVEHFGKTQGIEQDSVLIL